MPIDKESLKARLMKRYSEQLDKMFDQLSEDEPLHLTQIEEAALQTRQRVGQSITEELVTSESQKREADVFCPECQAVMRSKGMKKKWVKTRSGAVQVNRPYYYCDPCKAGHFPPR